MSAKQTQTKYLTFEEVAELYYSNPSCAWGKVEPEEYILNPNPNSFKHKRSYEYIDSDDDEHDDKRMRNVDECPYCFERKDLCYCDEVVRSEHSDGDSASDCDDKSIRSDVTCLNECQVCEEYWLDCECGGIDKYERECPCKYCAESNAVCSECFELVEDCECGDKTDICPCGKCYAASSICGVCKEFEVDCRCVEAGECDDYISSVTYEESRSVVVFNKAMKRIRLDEDDEEEVCKKIARG